MNRFMIGQFGKFDENKQNRDFRKDFFGIEACLFESDKDIEKLMDLIQKENISFGVHFPLKRDKDRLRDPQYLSLDYRKEYWYLF